MTLIKGITVVLTEREPAGTDEFNRTVYRETEVEVDNVLVSPSTTEDVVTSTSLYGKKSVYTIAIPKGDSHDWEDAKVRFFGKTWHTFGFVQAGIEDNVPLDWNGKVMCERYG